MILAPHCPIPHWKSLHVPHRPDTGSYAGRGALRRCWWPQSAQVCGTGNSGMLRELVRQRGVWSSGQLPYLVLPNNLIKQDEFNTSHAWFAKQSTTFDTLKLVNTNLCTDGYKHGVVEMMWSFHSQRVFLSILD